MFGQLVVGSIFLGLLLSSVLVHYLFSSTLNTTNIQTLSKLSSFTNLSLSVAFYEPRLSIDKEYIHPSYPSMPTLNKRDFIYEK